MCTQPINWYVCVNSTFIVLVKMVLFFIENFISLLKTMKKEFRQSTNLHPHKLPFLIFCGHVKFRKVTIKSTTNYFILMSILTKCVVFLFFYFFLPDIQSVTVLKNKINDKILMIKNYSWCHLHPFSGHVSGQYGYT